MDETQDQSCPCGSGKDYQDCCKKEFDRLNTENAVKAGIKSKIKAALANSNTKIELQELLKQAANKK
jgi:uncharacterized protein YchJ